MQYVVKIYSKQSDSTPIAQISDIVDLTISEDISSISNCTVVLAPNVPNIAQYRKIEVYEVEENSDTRVFMGYIDSYSPAIDKITLSCKNEKCLLARKLVTIDRSFSGQTIASIITTILTDWNGTYSEDWSVSCSDTTPITKEVNIGDNLYDIIDELATDIGAVWDSKERVVIISQLLGTDYTSAENFKELVYNGENPRENNINDLAYESYGTLSNVIIGDDGSTKNTQSDSASIAIYGALAEYVSFRTGGLTNSVAKYLESKKGGQFAYSIVADPFKFSANCGDKVALRIENVSDYFDYIGDVIINTKSSKIVNGMKICSYEVSDKYVYFDSFVKRFLSVESDVNLKLVR